jgi:hypothetical protein
VRSLQVKFARHTIERDRGLDQPVFRFDEIENAGNAEFGSELSGLHRSFLSRRSSLPIATQQRHHEVSARRCRNSPRRVAMKAPDEVAVMPRAGASS